MVFSFLIFDVAPHTVENHQPRRKRAIASGAKTATNAAAHSSERPTYQVVLCSSSV
jgi:hypothetical protein